jgi:hypothetical protein
VAEQPACLAKSPLLTLAKFLFWCNAINGGYPACNFRCIPTPAGQFITTLKLLFGLLQDAQDKFRISQNALITLQKMGMVGHQYPSIAAGLCLRNQRFQPFQKVLIIRLVLENVSSFDPPDNDMVDYPGRTDSWQTRHTATIIKVN